MPDLPKADNRQLRNFSITVGTAVGLVFGLLLPWIGSAPLPAWPWVVMVLLGSWGVTAPATLAPVYRAWMRAAEVLGNFNNRIVLAFVFFAVVLPLGMVRRAFGRDAMQRQFEPLVQSYRIAKAPIGSDSMERPF